MSTIKACKEIDRARAFIRLHVNDELRHAGELLDLANKQGISKMTLHRAAVGLVVTKKVGNKWYWRRLPQDSVTPMFFRGY